MVFCVYSRIIFYLQMVPSQQMECSFSSHPVQPVFPGCCFSSLRLLKEKQLTELCHCCFNIQRVHISSQGKFWAKQRSLTITGVNNFIWSSAKNGYGHAEYCYQALAYRFLSRVCSFQMLRTMLKQRRLNICSDKPPLKYFQSTAMLP